MPFEYIVDTRFVGFPIDGMVTAIMPTRGRQRWAAEALEMFRAQTWEEKELVIVDDLDEPSFATPVNSDDDVMITYFRVRRDSIGVKRNFAIQMSLGNVIIHWDSDDIYERNRIEVQVGQLLDSGKQIAGFNSMNFVDADTGERWHFHQSMPIGASLCYFRSAWQERPFSDAQVGEDAEFTHVRPCFACDAGDLIVARVHNGNTSDRRKIIAANPLVWEKIA